MKHSFSFRSRPVSVLALGATLLLAAACGGETAAIRIGIAGPFSEPRGQSMLAAARLAVEEINSQRGGVRGRPLELVIEDDSAQNSRAIQIAQRFRDDPTVVAVVGHLTSGTTIAAADIYNHGARPIVAISPSASNPELTGIGRYTFRVCATDLVHGTVLARFAMQRLSARNAAIVYLNDDYGRGILGTFADEMRSLGGTIVSQDPVLGGRTDVAPYLDRLQQQGERPQVIMLAGDRGTAVTVLRQARARGITIPLIGGDALSGIQTEGALAEGVYLTSNYLPERPGEINAAFLAAYAAANNDALPDHRGAGAYDAVQIIAAAIEEAGTDRAKVRDAIAAVGNARSAYEGVTGRIAFDERGDVKEKSVLIGVIRGGRLTMVEGQ